MHAPSSKLGFASRPSREAISKAVVAKELGAHSQDGRRSSQVAAWPTMGAAGQEEEAMGKTKEAAGLVPLKEAGFKGGEEGLNIQEKIERTGLQRLRVRGIVRRESICLFCQR